MPEEIRVGRGGARPEGQVQYHQGRRGSMVPWMILVVLIVVLGVVGLLFRDKLFGAKTSTTTPQATNSGYQAVFLTNGQVYFGKLSDLSSEYMTLSDIYYLQVTQPPLQGSQQQGAAAQTPEAQPQLSLVKLGNELHGPVDSMKINREQVLFYEDMKSDAKVMEAINQYKANPDAAQQPQSQGTTPSQQAPATTTPSTQGR